MPRCGRGVAHRGDLHFYRLEVEQFVLNVEAIQRQHGLEQFLGSTALAFVMGPDEHMAEGLGLRRGLLCADCALRLPAGGSGGGEMSDHHATLRRLIHEEAHPDVIVFHYVRAVLEDCEGNVSATARRLGMHRRTLQRMLARQKPRSRR